MLEIEPKVDKSAWKEFTFLIGNLPLETCSRECIPVTEQWGWKAPKNKVFRISGHFIVDSDQSDIEYRYMPLRSAAIWIEEHGNLYEEYLKETDGNQNEALRELVNDITWGAANDTPPTFFDGKWLVIHPDLTQGFEINRAGKLGKPELIIKSNVEAWTDRNEYFEEIRDVNPQSSMITEVFFASQKLGQHWKQYCAEAVLSKCKIELIDTPEEEKKVHIPEPKDEKHLYLPEGTGEKGTDANCEFSMHTKRRPNGREREQLKDFKKNSGLIFTEAYPFSDSDLLVAQRKNKILLPEKKTSRDKLIKPQIINRKR